MNAERAASPRTDAVTEYGEMTHTVPAEFARTLERELAEHSKWRNRFAELMQNGGMEDWAFIFGQVRASVWMNAELFAAREQVARMAENDRLQMERAIKAEAALATVTRERDKHMAAVAAYNEDCKTCEAALAACRQDAERYKMKRGIDSQRFTETPAYCKASESEKTSLLAAWNLTYDSVIDECIAMSAQGPT